MQTYAILLPQTRSAVCRERVNFLIVVRNRARHKYLLIRQRPAVCTALVIRTRCRNWRRPLTAIAIHLHARAQRTYFAPSVWVCYITIDPVRK